MESVVPHPVEWALLLQSGGFAIALAVAFVNVRKYLLDANASLKTDLEILKLLRDDHPHRVFVEEAIELRLAARFGVPGRYRVIPFGRRFSSALWRIAAGVSLSGIAYVALLRAFGTVAVLAGFFGPLLVFAGIAALWEREYLFPKELSRGAAPVQPKRRPGTA